MTTKHTPLPWRRVQGVSGSDFVGPDGGLTISGVYRDADADYVDRAVNAHDDLVAALEAIADFRHPTSFEVEAVNMRFLARVTLNKMRAAEIGRTALIDTSAALAKAKGG